VLLGAQPVLGYLHHRQYLRTRRRAPVSHAHIWWGRLLMVLGVINGGLGLQLAGERGDLVTAYSVVSGFLLVAYAGAKFCDHFRHEQHVAFFRRARPNQQPCDAHTSDGNTSSAHTYA
jgi:hypothetical protein